MTREEAYNEGFQEGRRWAEADLANAQGSAWMNDLLRSEGTLALERRVLGPAHDQYAAEAMGQARGYRDTVARFEAGTLTREMFKMAPRGGGR